MTDNFEKFTLSIIVPEKVVFSGDVEMAILPGTSGEFGVLPGHISFISTLKSDIIKIYSGSDIISKFFVKSGFVEVNERSTTVLTSFAIDLNQTNIIEIKSLISGLEMKLSRDESDMFIRDEIDNYRQVLSLLS